jgi:nucleoid DNA-binding protein
MKKPEIARRMARQSGVTRGEAADRLDRLVREILGGLRQGKPARLPGLGCFRAGVDGRVIFEREAHREAKKRCD